MKANILVVDDDSNIIKVIKDFLEMENYNIYVAEDGKTALMLLGEKIDLIILDINLPDIDGIELCKKVRNYLNVPIIFLSARIEESDKIIGLRAGGDDYIIKPFSLGELQARIEAHLRRERKKHDRRKVYSDGKLWIDYKEKKIFYNECGCEFDGQLPVHLQADGKQENKNFELQKRKTAGTFRKADGICGLGCVSISYAGT